MVDLQVVDKLSAKSPTSEAKFKLLKEIAAEHDVDWNTTSFEEEITKVHEDLLVRCYPSYLKFFSFVVTWISKTAY